MNDGIIKETGNSRLLRSPSTIPDNYMDFRAALIAGTLPIDLLYNAAGWESEGTPLNKANLISDATAAIFGITGDNATPNKALSLALPKETFDTFDSGLKIVSGTYTGARTGSVTPPVYRNIDLGFQPDAVFVFANMMTTNTGDVQFGMATTTIPQKTETGIFNALAVYSSGFTVSNGYSGSTDHSILDLNSRIYKYIAFKRV